MIFSGNNFLSLSDQTSVTFLTEISLNNSTGSCNFGLNSGSVSQFNFRLNNGKIYDPENRFVYSYEAAEKFSISGEVSSGQYSYYINGTPIVLNKYKNNLPVIITDYYINTNNCFADGSIDILGEKQNLNISLNNKFFGQNLLTGIILVDKNFNFKIISGEASSNPTNFTLNYLPYKTGYFTINTSNLLQVEPKKSYVVNLDLYTNFGKISRTFYTQGILSGDLIKIFKILDDVYTNPYFSGAPGEVVSNTYNLQYNMVSADDYSSEDLDKKLKIKFEYFGGFTGETTQNIFSSGYANDFTLTGIISGTGIIENNIDITLTGYPSFLIGATNSSAIITGKKTFNVFQSYSITQNNIQQTIEFIGTGAATTGITSQINFPATGRFATGLGSGYITKVGIITGTFNNIIGSGYYINNIFSGAIETGFLYKNQFFTGVSIYNLANDVGTGIATGFSTGLFVSTGYANVFVSGFITGSGFLTSNPITYNATGKMSGDLNNVTYVKSITQRFLSPRSATGTFNFNTIATGSGIGTVLYFEDLSVQDYSSFNPSPNNWGLILLSSKKLTGYGQILNSDTYLDLDRLNKNNYFKKIYTQANMLYAVNDKDQIFCTGLNKSISSGISIVNSSSSTTGVEKIALSRTSWGCLLYKNGIVSGFGDITSASFYTPANILTGVKDIALGQSYGVALLNNGRITGWSPSLVRRSTNFENKYYLTGIDKIISNSSAYTNNSKIVLLNNGKIATLNTPFQFSSGLFGLRYTGYFSDDPSFFDKDYFDKNSPTSQQIINVINNFTDNIDGYSWQWIGYFVPRTTENYTFYTRSDDASYAWLGNNALTGYTSQNALVKNGGAHAPTEASGTISLISGNAYPLRIQFGDYGGADTMTFSFSTPTIPKTSNGSGYFFYSNSIQDQIVNEANKFLTKDYKYLTHNSDANYLLSITPDNKITGWGTGAYFYLNDILNQSKNLSGIDKIYINNESVFALLKNHAMTGLSPSSFGAPNSIYEFPYNIYNGQSLSGIEVNSYGYKNILGTGFISGTGLLFGTGFGLLIDEDGEEVDANFSGSFLYFAKGIDYNIFGLRGKKYAGYFADNPNWFQTQNVLNSSIYTSINTFNENDIYSYEWTGLFYTKSGAGNYTFYIESDDAGYFWIGNTAVAGFTTGNALIKNGGLHGPVAKSGIINLNADTYYPVRINFGNAGGLGVITFRFSSPGSSDLNSDLSDSFFYKTIDPNDQNNLYYNYNIKGTGLSNLVTGINTNDFAFTGSKNTNIVLTGNIIGSGLVNSAVSSHPYVESGATGYYRLYQNFDFQYYFTSGVLKSPKYSEFMYFTGNNFEYISNDPCTGLADGYNVTNFIYSGKGISGRYTGAIYGTGLLYPVNRQLITVTGYLSGDNQTPSLADGLRGRAYNSAFNWAGNLEDYLISPSVISEYPRITNFNRFATVLNTNNYFNNFIGYFLPRATENYTFYILGDDAAAFWIGANAISGYVTGNALKATTTYGQWFSGSINLTSGVYYPIRIIGSQGGGTDYVMFAVKSNSINETVNGFRIEKSDLKGYLYSEPFEEKLKNNLNIDLGFKENVKRVDLLFPQITLSQTYTGNFNANVNYLITGIGSGNFPNPVLLNVSGIFNLRTGLTFFPNDNGVKDFTLSNLEASFPYVSKITYPPIYSETGERGCIALLSNGRVTGINQLMSLYYPFVNNTTLSSLTGMRDIFLSESYALYAVPNNGKVTGLGLPTGGLSISSSYSGFITGFNNLNGDSIIKIVNGGIGSLALLTGNRITGCGQGIPTTIYPLLNSFTGVKDIGLQSDLGFVVFNTNRITGFPLYSPSSFVAQYQLTSANSLNNIEKIEIGSSKTLCLVNPNKRLIGFGASAQPAEQLFTGNYIGLTGKRYIGYFDDNPYWFNSATATGTTGFNFLSPSNYNGGYNYNSSIQESFEFTGWFKPGKNENYTFYTFSDDASYIWLGEVALTGYNTGNALVWNGLGHGGLEKSGTINLTGSYYYPIRIQYGNGAGAGGFSCYYSGQSMTGRLNIGAYPPIGHTGASGNYFFRDLDNFVKATWNNRFILTGIKDFEINNFYAVAVLNDNSITGWNWGDPYPDLVKIIASGRGINNFSGLAITNYQAYALLNDGKLTALNNNYPQDIIDSSNLYTQTFYAQDTNLKPIFPVGTFSRVNPNLLITGTGIFERIYTGDISSYDTNINILNDLFLSSRNQVQIGSTNSFTTTTNAYNENTNKLLTGRWLCTGKMKVFENLLFNVNNSGQRTLNSVKTGIGVNPYQLNTVSGNIDVGVLVGKYYFPYFNDDLNIIYPPKINQTSLSNNNNYINGNIWSFDFNIDGLYEPIANQNIYRFKSAEINRLASIFNPNEFSPFDDTIMIYENGEMPLESFQSNIPNPNFKQITSLPTFDGTGKYFYYDMYGSPYAGYDASDYAIPENSLILIYSNQTSGNWNINSGSKAIIYKDQPVDWTQDIYSDRISNYSNVYDNFTIEWTGFFIPQRSTFHTFFTNSDDASYFWLGDSAVTGFTTGNALVKNGGIHFSTVKSGVPVFLTRNTRYPVRLIYGSLNDGQVISLYYRESGFGTFNRTDGFFSDVKTTRLQNVNLKPNNFSGYVTNILGTGFILNQKNVTLTGKLFDGQSLLPIIGDLTGTTYDYVTGHELNVNKIITGVLLNPFSVKDNQYIQTNQIFYGSGYLNTKITRTGIFIDSGFANVSGRSRSKYKIVTTGLISSGRSVLINNNAGSANFNNLIVQQDDIFYPNYFYNNSNYNVFTKNSEGYIPDITLFGTGYFTGQTSGFIYGFDNIRESGRWYVTGNLSGRTFLNYTQNDSGNKYFNTSITGVLINPAILNQTGIVKTMISGTGNLDRFIDGSGLMTDILSGNPVGTIFSNSSITGISILSGLFKQNITGNAINGIINYNNFVSGIRNGILYTKFLDYVSATGLVSVQSGGYVGYDYIDFKYIKTFLNTFNIKTGYYNNGLKTGEIDFSQKNYFHVTKGGNHPEGYYHQDSNIDKNIDIIYFQIDYLNKYDDYPLTGKLSLTGYNIYNNQLYSGTIFVTGNKTGNI